MVKSMGSHLPRLTQVMLLVIAWLNSNRNQAEPFIQHHLSRGQLAIWYQVDYILPLFPEMSFILNGINNSGYGFAHPACRTPANNTITGLLECLIYCHGILNNTTLNQGNYFKAKEMCQWTPDHEHHYFHDASVAARSSRPLLEQKHIFHSYSPLVLCRKKAHT